MWSEGSGLSLGQEFVCKVLFLFHCVTGVFGLVCISVMRTDVDHVLYTFVFDSRRGRVHRQTILASRKIESVRSETRSRFDGNGGFLRQDEDGPKIRRRTKRRDANTLCDSDEGRTQNGNECVENVRDLIKKTIHASLEPSEILKDRAVATMILHIISENRLMK